MIAVQAAPLVFGETILLHVTPVYPFDAFRGDYVMLNYDINRLAAPGREAAPWTPRDGWTDAMLNRPVYVTLEPDADGKHWHVGKTSLQCPADGKYIRGRYTGDYRQPVQFGIEAYYVQEGKGMEWERLRNSRKLSAEIALAPWGQAKLRKLIADE